MTSAKMAVFAGLEMPEISERAVDLAKVRDRLDPSDLPGCDELIKEGIWDVLELPTCLDSSFEAPASPERLRTVEAIYRRCGEELPEVKASAAFVSAALVSRLSSDPAEIAGYIKKAFVYTPNPSVVRDQQLSQLRAKYVDPYLLTSTESKPKDLTPQQKEEAIKVAKAIYESRYSSDLDTYAVLTGITYMFQLGYPPAQTIPAIILAQSLSEKMTPQQKAHLGQLSDLLLEPALVVEPMTGRKLDPLDAAMRYEVADMVAQNPKANSRVRNQAALASASLAERATGDVRQSATALMRLAGMRDGLTNEQKRSYDDILNFYFPAQPQNAKSSIGLELADAVIILNTSVGRQRELVGRARALKTYLNRPKVELSRKASADLGRLHQFLNQDHEVRQTALPLPDTDSTAPETR